MKEISLKDLLEAGCHFGHRTQRWHPKASSFIYQVREGMHIIDLAKTRDALKKAAEFLYELGSSNKNLLMVGTKRQARGVVTEAAKRVGAFYLTNRWIGGFLTNWEEVRKNIEKVNRYRTQKKEGEWSKFPKHEQVKLERILRQLEAVYEGVSRAKELPEALFIVDIKKEFTSLKEANRQGITTVAIVDTNSDPTQVDFPVPANDDAVGSIQYVVNYLADAYKEGKLQEEKKKEEEGQKEKKMDKETPKGFSKEESKVIKKTKRRKPRQKEKAEKA